MSKLNIYSSFFANIFHWYFWLDGLLHYKNSIDFYQGFSVVRLRFSVYVRTNISFESEVSK